jgi:hypothetical protein
MIVNDKYIVFKSEEWIEWLMSPKQRLLPGDKLPEMLPDAVVIRRQDIFAGPGLSAYASAIQTYIEAFRQIIEVEDGRLFVEENVPILGSLIALRDFFHEQAQIAFDHPNKKVPD